MNNDSAGAGGIATAPLEDLPEVPVPPIGGTPEDPRLIGSRCESCGEQFFPRRAMCYACAGRQLTDVELGPRGSLYSFTTVHVSSNRETPYSIGYVDLTEGVRVLGRLDADASDLKPGQDVLLEVTGDDWRFAPVNEGETS